jgi:hypothetical protein
VNAWCYGDCYVQAKGGNALAFWVGDCCDMCSNPMLVSFKDVSSPHERVYCIEPKALRGKDAPRVFVVARAIEVAPYRSNELVANREPRLT